MWVVGFWVIVFVVCFRMVCRVSWAVSVFSCMVSRWFRVIIVRYGVFHGFSGGRFGFAVSSTMFLTGSRRFKSAWADCLMSFLGLFRCFSISRKISRGFSVL